MSKALLLAPVAEHSRRPWLGKSLYRIVFSRMGCCPCRVEQLFRPIELFQILSSHDHTHWKSLLILLCKLAWSRSDWIDGIFASRGADSEVFVVALLSFSARLSTQNSLNSKKIQLCALWLRQEVERGSNIFINVCFCLWVHLNTPVADQTRNEWRIKYENIISTCSSVITSIMDSREIPRRRQRAAPRQWVQRWQKQEEENLRCENKDENHSPDLKREEGRWRRFMLCKSRLCQEKKI